MEQNKGLCLHTTVVVQKQYICHVEPFLYIVAEQIWYDIATQLAWSDLCTRPSDGDARCWCHVVISSCAIYVHGWYNMQLQWSFRVAR